jgi:DNA-binding ferritin-like protein (Dps family)
MREEVQRIVDLCKEFVTAMSRVEDAFGTIGAQLTKEERAEVVKDVLAFLGSGEVKGMYTQEVARELIAQLGAAGMYTDYKGSTDAYIQ